MPFFLSFCHFAKNTHSVSAEKNYASDFVVRETMTTILESDGEKISQNDSATESEMLPAPTIVDSPLPAASVDENVASLSAPQSSIEINQWPSEDLAGDKKLSQAAPSTGPISLHTIQDTTALVEKTAAVPDKTPAEVQLNTTQPAGNAETHISVEALPLSKEYHPAASPATSKLPILSVPSEEDVGLLKVALAMAVANQDYLKAAELKKNLDEAEALRAATAKQPLQKFDLSKTSLQHAQQGGNAIFEQLQKLLQQQQQSEVQDGNGVRAPNQVKTAVSSTSTIGATTTVAWNQAPPSTSPVAMSSVSSTGDAASPSTRIPPSSETQAADSPSFWAPITDWWGKKKTNANAEEGSKLAGATGISSDSSFAASSQLTNTSPSTCDSLPSPPPPPPITGISGPEPENQGDRSLMSSITFACFKDQEGEDEGDDTHAPLTLSHEELEKLMADMLVARKALERAKEVANEKQTAVTERQRRLDEVVGRRAGLNQQMMHMLENDESLKKAAPPAPGDTVDVLLEPNEATSSYSSSSLPPALAAKVQPPELSKDLTVQMKRISKDAEKFARLEQVARKDLLKAEAELEAAQLVLEEATAKKREVSDLLTAVTEADKDELVVTGGDSVENKVLEERMTAMAMDN